MTSAAGPTPVRAANSLRDDERVSSFAIPVAVGAIIFLLTVPIWFRLALVAALWVMLVDPAGIGAAVGLGILGLPVVVGTTFIAGSASCGASARRVAEQWPQPAGRDLGRVRAAWSVVGAIAGALGAVSYVVVSIVAGFS